MLNSFRQPSEYINGWLADIPKDSMISRTQALEKAKKEKFDLVVIGGGITGAGVAQNAAHRGMSVLVIEKNDFASGTSSKTTKLIHGGLRYLEQFHFKLCRQLCDERERLKKLAPHMVRDFSFVLPFSKNLFFNTKVTLGLTAYDLLTFTSGTGNFHRPMSRKRVCELVPALTAPSITGGIEFHDAISDDSRLVLAVLKSASEKGATVVNYVQVTGFERNNDQIVGVHCRDRMTGEEFSVPCRACVNATGVWTDEILAYLPDGNGPKRMCPSKGVHVIVPPSAFETRTACFLPTPDGRFVFVVPWLRGLMIGTTDTAYDGDIERPAATLDDVDYLIGIVNSYTQTHKLQRKDIKGTFAGLRPLVKITTDGAGGTSAMSREHLIFESPGKLLNVAGGKLTSYRLMAQEVVDHLVKLHAGLQAKNTTTDTVMLGLFRSPEDYLAATAEIAARGRKLSLEPAVVDHLIANYGKEAMAILDLVETESTLSERICPDFPPIVAEVIFGTRAEMAVSLEDMLYRRLRLGLLNYDQTMAAAPKVARIMKELSGWDDFRMKAELQSLADEAPVTIAAQATAG